MKILVLSHYFTPEPITKPLEIAEALRDAGHSVHVVTGFPNYPDGKLYPGYPLRLFRRDTIAGIPVIRTWVYPSHGSSRVGRLLNYASFMLSSIAGGLVAGRFDAMYVWHPPLSIGVSAAAIAAFRRKALCLRRPGHLAGECNCDRLSSARLDVQPSRARREIRLQACGAHLRRDRGCEGESDRQGSVARQDHGRAPLVR